MSHGYSSGRSHSGDRSGAYYYLVNHVNDDTVLGRCCLVLILRRTLVVNVRARTYVKTTLAQLPLCKPCADSNKNLSLNLI